MAKRLGELEARSALAAGYWITLKSDPHLGQTSDSVITEYEAAHGHDPDRHYIVWQLVDPKDEQSCA